MLHQIPVEAALDALHLQIARLSFPEFLRYVTIKDGRDPRGFIDFEPWPHLLEIADSWWKREDDIVLKSRQLGISWLAAAYACWTILTRKNSTVLLLSQGEKEAVEMKDRVAFVHTHLPEALQLPVVKDIEPEFSLAGGGRVLPFPATEKAGRSFTFDLVVVDEAAMHPYAQENFAAYEPTLDSGGQLLMISTANGDTNFFAQMFWAAWRKESRFHGRFLPWWVRPPRDQAWYDAKRAGYVGFYDDFLSEYPATPEEAFSSREGMVYPMWSERKHVLDADPFRWEDAKLRVAGVDFGGGDPSAIVTLGVSGTGKIHQFDEFYQKGAVTVEHLGTWLMRQHARAPLYGIYCDPSEPVAIASLRSSGLPAVAADNRRDGIGFTASLLEQGRLTLGARCEASRREFGGYKWRERLDPNSRERYETTTPVDHHADAMDARRYALVALMQMEMARQKHIENLTGRPLSRFAV